LSVLMFDVDGFSRINEEFGHLAGDAILAQLGKRLARRIRREDILARTGGGEFALVTPEVAKEGAMNLGDRLLRMISETAFGFDDVQIPVTLSIGVAAIAEVQVPDSDFETAPGARAGSVHTPGDGGSSAVASDPFSQVGNASSITSEFSMFETSRSGEVVERFHAASENLLGLGRQRLAHAKANGKGRMVS